MIYVGIDPGYKGAYAVIDNAHVRVYPWDDSLFVSDMNALRAMEDGIMAAVEKVGARPGQGVVSMFNFGKNAGYIEGVLSALGIPYQLIPPAKWKKEYSLIGKDKNASIFACRHLFPELNLKRTERCRTDNDGKAEAALIAEYARRHFREGRAK